MHIVSFTRSMCPKSKRTYHMLLTSENTAGSTNTAAENNCNSFILDNRLSSCRYEIYEPLLRQLHHRGWVSCCSQTTLLYVENLGYPLLGQYMYAKEVSFYLLHKLLTDGITTSFLSVAVVCVT